MNTRHHYLSLLRTFALATLTAAAVAACTDDNGDPAGSEPIAPADGIPVTFTANINPGSDADPAGAPDTRTVLKPDGRNGFTVEWKGTDNNPTSGYDLIEIWAAMGNTLANGGWNKTYVPTTSEASSVLEPGDGSQLTLTSSGEWNFTAIYGTNNTIIGKAPASISPLTQSAPGKTEHIAAKDFSVATVAKMVAANSEMPAIISFKFKHMLSALQLQVKNGTSEALTVNEIRLSVTGEKITTKKYYGVTDKGWITHNDEQESDYLQLKIQTPAALASNATEPQKFHMLLFPGYENKTLIITVITDRGEYTLTKGAPTGGFLAGKNYLTDITITSTPGTNETWTETISTPEQLAAFRNKVNGGDNYTGKTVRLTKDIALTGEWTPIGQNSLKAFQGTFDGGGHHISNLTVSNGTNSVGLFGAVTNNGTVRNLRVSGNVTATGTNVGGIVGFFKGSILENCIFSGDVKGKQSVGGIAGKNATNSRITGCYTKGSVSAEITAGGIAGENTGVINGCYSEATVTTSSRNAGGIAGVNENSSTVTLCYATGAISGVNPDGGSGGIVGYNFGTVENCIALNPRLTRTSGNSTNFGRIVGYNDGGTVNSCGAFKDMTITDATSSFIGTGKHGTDLTAAECLTPAAYTSRGFAAATATTAGWAFDSSSPWTYLPWNSAFETFSGIQPADYRIEKAFTQP